MVMDELTLRTEEKLTALIEKIITKSLDEQQQKLLNIIKGDLEISKQQIPELKKEIKLTNEEKAQNMLKMF